MAKTFDELRRGGAQSFRRLRSDHRFDLGTHKMTKLERAGCVGSQTILHDAIAKAHARLLLDNLVSHTRSWSETEARQRLRFLTILHTVSPLEWRTIMDDVHRMENSLYKIGEELAVWGLSATEIEIVNIDLLWRVREQTGDKARKLRVLQAMAPKGLVNGALVHLHAVVDLGTNSILLEPEFRRLMEAVVAWQRSSYQIKLQPLFQIAACLKACPSFPRTSPRVAIEHLRYSAGFGRDLPDDLEAKMWRSSCLPFPENVTDERGLTVGEIQLLDHVLRLLQRRNRANRGYLVPVGPG